MLALSTVLLSANEGKILFEKHCMQCHVPFISMSKLKENFLEHNNTLLKLEAPTLNQLSYRLKQRIGDRHGDEDIHRMEVTAFMSDYVLHPDKQKSVCLSEVLAFFKTMPSMKGKVDNDALEEIGTYLYDFDDAVVKQKGLVYQGFSDSQAKAKKEHKIIMIKAMSKDCHFCRKMDREVMIEDEVINAIEKDFIPVSIDVAVHQLPLGLKVEVTPSFIFISEDGKVISNIPGFWDKKDFLSLLKDVKSRTKKELK